MLAFNDLKRNLKNNSLPLPSIKVALLGDTATQLLAIALQGMAIERGYKLNLFEAGCDQIERQILVSGSEFHSFAAKYNIVFQSTLKLLNAYNKMELVRREELAEERIQFVRRICAACHEPIIYCNYPEIDDTVHGSYANKTRQSFIYQVRKLNYELMNLAEGTPNLFICDLAATQAKLGRDFCFDSSFYVNGEMVISSESLPHAAARMMDIICACQGTLKKCLIFDLDNTIWGGIIGDVGIEGIQIGQGIGVGKVFTEFQYWLKKLEERGVILAVCSKNDEELAKEPFLKHPEMVLHLDDISLFMANWINKADNIRQIQSILNIGFDSMVFLDDSAIERAIVRENIPAVTVPELPEDPSDYLECLYGMNLFETASFSNADHNRTKMYREEYVRTQAVAEFTNECDFLRSLEMKATIKPFEQFDVPRITELSQRSNQFNLRTVRYTEVDVKILAKDQNHQNFSFTLKDKHGSYGLICIVILKKIDHETLFIENWIMSCRALKRSMENYTMNQIASYASKTGYKRIIGEYIPTNKNKIVAGHYQGLGFVKLEESKSNVARYILNVNLFTKLDCFIDNL
jgi:FkbH-like protein